MTGPADFVAAAEAQEHQLVGRIDDLVGIRRVHGRRLPLGSHDCGQWRGRRRGEVN